MKTVLDEKATALKARGFFALLSFCAGISVAAGLPLQKKVGPPAAANRTLAPARSTTGPRPPRGVDARGRRLTRRQLEEAEVVPGVPAYLWRHGSGPAAVGMVLGYYDTHGFPDLLPGNASAQTDAVNLALASIAHYNDYALPLDAAGAVLEDKSEPPEGDEHAADCLADFLKTSWSVTDAHYGWGWSIDVKPGYESYVRLASRYEPLMTHSHIGNFPFQTIRNEIESRRPVVLLVDTDGDGASDHFVTAVGVLTEGGTDYYGCYHTWDGLLHWYPYRPMSAGAAWGVRDVFLCFLSYGIFPPSAFSVERLANDLIFFREGVNRLSWAPNPANKAVIVRYRISRKVKGAENKTYALLAEPDAAATFYDDRNLRASDLFTYRISAIDAAGRESAFSTAGN